MQWNPVINFFYFWQTSTKYNYLFSGESEHWNGKYKVNCYADIYESTLTLAYKGDISELYTMRALEYSYESTASKGKYKRSFSKPTNKKIFINENVDIGTAEQQNETIKVTVIWDGDNGRTEVLFLKNTRQK